MYFGVLETKVKKIYKLLKLFKIDIFAYCDNNENLWGNTLHNGSVPILSPVQLKELVDKGEYIMVQIAFEITKKDAIKNQIESLGITKYITLQETYSILKVLRRYKLLQNDFRIKKTTNPTNWAAGLENLHIDSLNNLNTTFLFKCTPPKTGTRTTTQLLQASGIQFSQSGVILLADEQLSTLREAYDTVKIITGVRDPIGQNLSLLYQFVTVLHNVYEDLFLPLATPLLHQETPQTLFDTLMDFLGYTNEENKNEMVHPHVQGFVSEFQKNILDIMKEPFDKEKGYSIIKEGNLEVFVYQLEKLNLAGPALAEFVGGNVSEIKKENAAANKWIAESYEEAKKELRFSKEYFDKCYDEPYIKHFYSDEDIEKMKNKWRKNIRKEGE